jgi:hypothetical protein
MCSAAYGKRMKVYPLAQAVNPPATVFTDVKDVDFDSTIRYDASYFDHLDRIVQSEPWIARDRAMIDQLKSLGIEKGKPFSPSDATKAILASAAREAGAVLEARYEAGLPPYFSATSRWTFPAMPEVIKAAGEGFTDPDSYPVDSRGLDYSYAFVAIKRLGAGQFYLISIRDKDGDFYDGAKTYRLHVPPNVPVEQYWSVTAYDRKTHALIKNIPRASRSSNATEVKKNNRTGRTRRQRRRRRTVPAQRHALVGMPLDAVGSRGPGRRARHGSDGRDLGDPSPLTR